MQFVRKIVDSQMLENIVEIPMELKNRKIEMLLLPVEQEESEKKARFDPRKFRGVTNIPEDILAKQIRELKKEITDSTEVENNTIEIDCRGDLGLST